MSDWGTQYQRPSDKEQKLIVLEIELEKERFNLEILRVTIRGEIAENILSSTFDPMYSEIVYEAYLTGETLKASRMVDQQAKMSKLLDDIMALKLEISNGK